MAKSGANTKIFFRNDDVRNSLDESLIQFTDLFIKHQMPISLAAEPANLSRDVVDWLLEKKTSYPELIEIIQHGYDHNLSNPDQKMEFGGKRSYDDQLADIRKGKALMDKYFGELWSPVFTFPYGTFNQATLKAVDEAGFTSISSKIMFTPKVKIKNIIGRKLRLNTIRGRKVNYHPDIRPGYRFREFSVSVNLIRKYLNNNSAEHYTMNELLRQLHIAENNTNIVGVLFHHKFHHQHLGLIEDFLLHLKSRNFSFLQIKELT
jgi:peptidoglycan/xylan/chitin deacetylase (PgdA/CDA1 family)